jgi:hypothetical protein
MTMQLLEANRRLDYQSEIRNSNCTMLQLILGFPDAVMHQARTKSIPSQRQQSSHQSAFSCPEFLA